MVLSGVVVVVRVKEAKQLGGFLYLPEGQLGLFVLLPRSSFPSATPIRS